MRPERREAHAEPLHRIPFAVAEGEVIGLALSLASRSATEPWRGTGWSI